MNSSEEPRSRVVEIVNSFPEAEVTEVGVHLKLEVRGKRFGWFMENHHGNERLELNCKGLPGVSQGLAEDNPAIFYIPSYNGKKGWVGIWMDVPGVDWEQVKELLYEAYLLTAPKRLIPKRLSARTLSQDFPS